MFDVAEDEMQNIQKAQNDYEKKKEHAYSIHHHHKFIIQQQQLMRDNAIGGRVSRPLLVISAVITNRKD